MASFIEKPNKKIKRLQAQSKVVRISWQERANSTPFLIHILF